MTWNELKKHIEQMDEEQSNTSVTILLVQSGDAEEPFENFVVVDEAMCFTKELGDINQPLLKVTTED